MKRQLLKLVILLFLSCVMITVKADPAVTDPNKAFIDQTINNFMRQNNIPGVAVDLYVNGVPHQYYYGFANPSQLVPVSPDTIFEIGSVTKVFTALLIAQEVNAGKLKLQDSIVKYLPDFSATAKAKLQNITIEDLGTHTSGLPFDLSARYNTMPQLMQFFNQWKPRLSAGAYWAYSNMGVGMLGYVLEDSTAESEDDLYRSQILNPLGMEPIATNVPDDLQANYAQGYSPGGRPVLKRVNMHLFPAAGSMKASAQDMLLFLRAALELPGTPASISDAMRITQTAYVEMPSRLQGLAWEIHPITASGLAALLHPPVFEKISPIPVTHLDSQASSFNGNNLIDKTGTTGGFRAYIAVIPNRKSGIVILANRCVTNAAIVGTARNILLKVNGIV